MTTRDPVELAYEAYRRSGAQFAPSWHNLKPRQQVNWRAAYRVAWEAGRDAAVEVAHDWCCATCPDTLREIEELKCPVGGEL